MSKRTPAGRVSPIRLLQYTAFVCPGTAATTIPLAMVATWGRAVWRRPDEEPA